MFDPVTNHVRRIQAKQRGGKPHIFGDEIKIEAKKHSEDEIRKKNELRKKREEEERKRQAAMYYYYNKSH